MIQINSESLTRQKVLDQLTGIVDERTFCGAQAFIGDFGGFIGKKGGYI